MVERDDEDNWYDVYRDLRDEQRKKRASSLKKADDTGWTKHTEYHWFRMMQDPRDTDPANQSVLYKMEYWPSSNKWYFRGQYYRGALPKALLAEIAKQNEAIYIGQGSEYLLP